jgi:hypothetical protein
MSLLQLTSLLSKWPTAPQKKKAILEEQHYWQGADTKTGTNASANQKTIAGNKKLGLGINKVTAFINKWSQKTKEQCVQVPKYLKLGWTHLKQFAGKSLLFMRDAVESFSGHEATQETLKEKL